MSKQLISEQRYAIYLGLARKSTKKSIAKEIGVHPSTITREIQRNSNRYGQYVHTIAQSRCDSRKHSTLGNHRKSGLLWWRIEQINFGGGAMLNAGCRVGYLVGYLISK